MQTAHQVLIRSAVRQLKALAAGCTLVRATSVNWKSDNFHGAKLSVTLRCGIDALDALATNVAETEFKFFSHLLADAHAVETRSEGDAAILRTDFLLIEIDEPEE